MYIRSIDGIHDIYNMVLKLASYLDFWRNYIYIYAVCVAFIQLRGLNSERVNPDENILGYLSS